MGGPIPADSGEGRGHPGQVASLSQGYIYRQTITLTFTPTDKLESSINLSIFLDCGRKPESKQLVTMRARSTDDKGVMFSSSATYRADGSGQIHLDRDPSLSGSYVGVEPMGLLWSMKPDTLHTCFRKTHLQMPHIVTLSVHDKEDNRMLAEVTNKRYLIGDGVSRIPKKEGNICVFATRILLILTQMFHAIGGGPFPAVLDLSSARFEKRACLLANKGFVVLSIMHLDHFEEAVNFLKWHSKVGSKGIGVISRSKGGDIALSIAAFVSGFEAVVCIGCNANVFFPLYYNKRLLLQPILSCYKKLISSVSGTVNDKYILDNHLEENNDALIPTELAKGQFLFVASEDDLSWDSKTYMDQMYSELSRGTVRVITVSEQCWQYLTKYQ
uniref:Acyl-CoA thioester hydrolase/bile acid-CoA amino acid N-acetyltransferase domain-containing protein n=1 Tax=Acanthochromis polyacanthus TaxID=80966 RepID=A0A3Q1EN29_9TELE